MENKVIKCEGRIDCGKSRIRGWHNTRECPHPAKFLVTMKDASIKCLCGIHKNELLKKVFPSEIASIQNLSDFQNHKVLKEASN